MSSQTISLAEAAEILSLSEDEVMFLVQTDRLSNSIDEESMTWIFGLSDVLVLKKELDEEKRLREEAAAEQEESIEE